MVCSTYTALFLIAFVCQSSWARAYPRDYNITNDYDQDSNDVYSPDNYIEDDIDNAIEDISDDTDDPEGRNGDPMIHPDRFEGDILAITPADVEGRNAIITANEMWPNGEVPFVISGFSTGQQNTIKKAMESYHTHTCIRFVGRTNQRDYIHISPGQGCSSMVGRRGNKQAVSLGQGCVYHGIVVHELMHAIGFWHEQSRPDRDSFVTINWDNIQSGMKHNFMKFPHGEVDTLGLSYDIGSVMHYGYNYFAKRQGLTTINANNPSDQSRMGQRNGFSMDDIKKIRRLYKCDGKKSNFHHKKAGH